MKPQVIKASIVLYFAGFAVAMLITKLAGGDAGEMLFLGFLGWNMFLAAALATAVVSYFVYRTLRAYLHYLDKVERS